MRRRTAAFAVLALTLVGCSSSGGGGPVGGGGGGTPHPTRSARHQAHSGPLARFYNQHLSWSSCGDNFECTRLRVPLDYAHPRGRTTQLAVIRLRASGDRIGSLVLNPGGPGASGVDFARNASYFVPSSVRDRFDVVGFDPRGVGDSDPINCVSTAFLQRFNALDPTDPGPQRAAYVSASKQFAHSCLTSMGPTRLRTDATINTARDMDVLRSALGDRKLTYVGKSYGTFLGSLYAKLFPHRVRALILDGPVDPSVSEEEISRVQGAGFEVALKAFLEDCVRQGCALGKTYASAESTLDALIHDSAVRPLFAGNYKYADGRTANRAVVELGITGALYDKAQGWKALRDGLAAALNGDGSELLELSDNLWGLHSTANTNLEEAFLAIACVDRPAPRSLARYVRDARVWGQEQPHFGAFESWGVLPCAYWPVRAVTAPAPIHAPSAPPILVIGTTRDPATPYVDAKALARQLPGILLAYDGDGHTVYGTGESSCVDAIGNAYLLDRKVPAPGTRC